MKIACRMGRDYQVEYFNQETGKVLVWEALKDAYAYTIPGIFSHENLYPIHNSMVKKGSRMPYRNMTNGYHERDFKLIEV